MRDRVYRIRGMYMHDRGFICTPWFINVDVWNNFNDFINDSFDIHSHESNYSRFINRYRFILRNLTIRKLIPLFFKYHFLHPTENGKATRVHTSRRITGGIPIDLQETQGWHFTGRVNNRALMRVPSLPPPNEPSAEAKFSISKTWSLSPGTSVCGGVKGEAGWSRKVGAQSGAPASGLNKTVYGSKT